MTIQNRARLAASVALFGMAAIGGMTASANSAQPGVSSPPVAGARTFDAAGSPGADRFDMQAALERWVEHGETPERVIPAKRGEPAFTRPLCVWPKTAHFSGSGSTSEAANFTCK